VFFAGDPSYLTHKESESVGFNYNFKCDQSPNTKYVKNVFLKNCNLMSMYLAHEKAQNYTYLCTELQYDFM
jgi:hypothetical protein